MNTNEENVLLLKSNQVISALKRMGFAVTKSKHSHKLLSNDNYKRTVVPSKSGMIISPLLLQRILKDLNIHINEFIEYL